jgi:hypothetical protein
LGRGTPVVGAHSRRRQRLAHPSPVFGSRASIGRRPRSGPLSSERPSTPSATLVRAFGAAEVRAQFREDAAFESKIAASLAPPFERGCGARSDCPRGAAAWEVGFLLSPLLLSEGSREAVHQIPSVTALVLVPWVLEQNLIACLVCMCHISSDTQRSL